MKTNNCCSIKCTSDGGGGGGGGEWSIRSVDFHALIRHSGRHKLKTNRKIEMNAKRALSFNACKRIFFSPFAAAPSSSSTSSFASCAFCFVLLLANNAIKCFNFRPARPRQSTTLNWCATMLLPFCCYCYTAFACLLLYDVRRGKSFSAPIRSQTPVQIEISVNKLRNKRSTKKNG